MYTSSVSLISAPFLIVLAPSSTLFFMQWEETSRARDEATTTSTETPRIWTTPSSSSSLERSRRTTKQLRQLLQRSYDADLHGRTDAP